MESEMHQVIAKLYNTNAGLEATKYCGEVVVFNCLNAKDETSHQQATRYADIFERHGNHLVDAVSVALGCDKVWYVIREVT
jgi:hypothetical protein